MSDEIFFDGARFVSASKAASSSELTRDYIGKLCRQGTLRGKRVGRNWFVDEKSLKEFLVSREYRSAVRSESLSQERSHAYRGGVLASAVAAPAAAAAATRAQFARALTSKSAQMALSSARVAPYAVTPALELAHKLVAATLAIMLTFGTFALLDPQETGILAAGARDNALALAADMRVSANAASQQFAAVAQDPFAPFSTLARTVNSSIDGFFAALTLPPVAESSSGSAVAIQVQPYQPAAAPANQISIATQSAPQPSAPSIIEKIVQVPVASAPPIDTSQFATHAEVAQLASQVGSLVSLIPAPTAYTPQYIAGNGVPGVTYAAAQSINQLSGTSISNPTITGGSISGVALDAGDLTGDVGVGEGGTGTSTAPSYGQLLLGDGTGGYALIATSTLGITSLPYYASSTIGNGSAAGGLTISGNATTTGNLLIAGTTSGSGILSFAGVNGSSIFNQEVRQSISGNTSTFLFNLDHGSLPGSNETNDIRFNGPNTMIDAVNSNDSLGIKFGESFSTGFVGLVSSGGSNGSVPSGGFLLSFALGNNGKVGSIVPATSFGSPTWRNVLDDGSGNMTISGTSTLTGGLLSFASSTIGNGTATGGLTVNGNATTTGNAYFAGNVGIGTAPSSETLDVENSFGVVTNNSSGYLRLVSGGSANYIESGLLYQSGSAAPLVFGNMTDNTEWARFDSSGRFGIGTTTPGSLLSVGNTNGINFSTGTSTFSSTGGINLASGCFAVNGTCITGGGGASLTGSMGQLAYFSGSNSAAGTSTLFLSPNGDFGIGTTSPWSLLTVSGGASGNAFEIDSSASAASTTMMTVSNAGLVSIGDDTGGSSGIFTVDASSSTTTISNLSIGNLEFDTDAGIVNLSDIPVDSNAASGVQEAQIINVGGNPLITASGISNGSGGVGSLNVGIGTSTSPYSTLQVWGPDTASTSALAIVNSASTTVFTVYDNGNATLSGSLSQNSDERLKTNIQSIDSTTSLEEILALNPVTFNWINTSQGTTQQIGFIAQEVQQIFPNLVSTTSPTALTPGGTLSVNYIGFIPAIVSAVQALASEVEQFAQSITTQLLAAQEVDTQKLCVGNVCVTQQQFLAMVAAANEQSNGTPDGSAAPDATSTTDDDDATTTPPVLEVNGNDPATVDVGAQYQDLGATITGPEGDLNLGIEASVDGGATTSASAIVIDTSAPGTHSILYSATDENGLVGYASREVNVIAATSTPANDASSTPDTNATSTPSTSDASSTPPQNDTSASSTNATSTQQ